MNSVIYQKTLIQARFTQDGEYPVLLVVTKEENGYAVFIIGSFFEGTVMLQWFFDRDKAIEFAVLKAPQDERVMRICDKDYVRDRETQ